MTVRGEADSGAFKVNSLGGLESADAASGHLVWEPGRSIWNNFKREALPTRSRLQSRGASSS